MGAAIPSALPAAVNALAKVPIPLFDILNLIDPPPF